MSSEVPAGNKIHAGDDLPPHLSERDVREAVDAADVLLDVQHSLRLSRKRTLTILTKRGLADEVRQAGPAMLDDLRESMGIEP